MINNFSLLEANSGSGLVYIHYSWGSFSPFEVYWGGAILGPWRARDEEPHLDPPTPTPLSATVDLTKNERQV